MSRRCGATSASRFARMFDTSIAARLLGDTEVGLQALVRNELGVELSKGSQRDDWSKRPLTAEAGGVRAGRCGAPDGARRAAHRAARRGGAHRVGARGVRGAREPAARARSGPVPTSSGGSRDRQSCRDGSKPCSASSTCGARNAPPPPIGRRSRSSGPRCCSRWPSSLRRRVDEVADALASYRRQRGQIEVVFAAIQRGLELPEDELPAREQGERTTLSPAARRRIEALRAWRDAAGQALASSIRRSSCRTRVIERIAVAGPRTLAELAAIEGMRRWRVTEWGPALLTACN